VNDASDRRAANSEPWFADLLANSGFLARYPQFAAFVAAMEPMATTAIPVMAIARHVRVDGKQVLRLYANRDYLRAHPEHFAGVLQHEIHHVLCGHLDDVRLHRVQAPKLMELAMEFSANENIVEPLPRGFVWQDFAEFGCAAGQSTFERYELLQKAQDDGRLMILSEDQLDALDPGWRDRAPNGDSQGGQRVVVMPSQRDHQSGLPQSQKPRVVGGDFVDEHRPGQHTGQGDRGLGDAIDRGSDAARPGTWRGDGWLMPPTDPAQIAKWQLAIVAHLRGEVGGAADVVRAGERAAKELPRQVQVDPAGGSIAWVSVLARLLGSRRVVQPTYLRPNRRFPERIGELPGRSRRPKRPRLLVGLDTSASMDGAVMGRCLAEIARLRRLATVTVAEVDAAVHRVHDGSLVEMVIGGGDTDFAPLFGLLAGRIDLDAAVYFTDGVGPWPAKAPSVPVLWVLTSERAFGCPWGVVVRLLGA
jgi:hypothetical protein